MSMDSCKGCGLPVDTDFDTDCYDNPAEQCACKSCREHGKPIHGWMPIASAPRDRDIDLAGYIEPSAEAYRNGSRAHWATGRGRSLWPTRTSEHGLWSGIIGGAPTHWAEGKGS